MKQILLLLILAAIGSVFYTNCSDLPVASCDASQQAEFHKLTERHELRSFDRKQDFMTQAEVEDVAGEFEAQNQCDLGPDLEPATEIERQVKL